MIHMFNSREVVKVQITLMSTETSNKLQGLPQELQHTVQQFMQLSVDDQLALFYLIYQKMGRSVTPAAPAATDPNLAPLLMGDFYQLPQEDQLNIMRQIVAGEDTEYSRAYGALKENNQLMVWFAWAQAMGDTVVGMPEGYESSQPIHEILNQIERLSFEHQISALRGIAGEMGYSEVQPISTQAETGKTPSL